METKLHIFPAFSFAVALTYLVLCSGIAQADGKTPVKSGFVVRGLTVTPTNPPGIPDETTGLTCDFSQEVLTQQDRLEDASVNCGSDSVQALARTLPQRFNAYCFVKAPVKSARIIKAPVKDNANHCSLSGITPQDATHQFGGAVWR